MDRLLLYSNKPSVIDRWRSVLDASSFTVSSFHSCNRLYRALPEASHHTTILYDYNAHPELLEELLAYVKSECPDVNVMAFNGKPSFEEGMNMLARGAKAYANTYLTAENLLQAIATVQSGNIWLNPAFIHTMIKSISMIQPMENKLASLSEREHELAKMIALGMSNSEIAEEMDITERTVKSHLSHIYEKLNIHNRLSLAIYFNKGHL
ncbi:MAG: response regulator transcription factor, partial [Campylobacterota bacterium]|nr:response regulator transcription factor [Campylobacterota bacterium]